MCSWRNNKCKKGKFHCKMDCSQGIIHLAAEDRRGLNANG